MLSAMRTVLVHMHFVWVILLVLDAGVIVILAHCALERNDVSHGSYLLQNLGDNTSTDCVTTLADSEAEAFLHGDVRHEGNGHHNVVARHGHFLTLGEGDGTGHVGGTEVELGLVAGEEGLVTATFCLGQDIDLCLELRAVSYT